MSLTPSSRLKRRLLKGMGVALLAAAVCVVLFSLWIELTYQTICGKAMREHRGDRMQALVACVESKACSYHEKNRALWALARLGDRRALPLLRKHVTGEPCDHDRDGFCQGELTEAIQQLEANQFNLPAFLWRGILDGVGRPDQTADTSSRPDLASGSRATRRTPDADYRTPTTVIDEPSSNSGS